MEVVVDGLIFENQAHGGISRIYGEILPRMCDLDSGLEIQLLTTGYARQSLPAHSRIHPVHIWPIDLLLRPKRLWGPLQFPARELAHRMKLGNRNGQIWHSTYYTMLSGWKGPKLVTVPDMIHEHFPGLFGGWKNAYFRQRKRRCILAADAVICISNTTKRDVQQFYNVDPDRLYVVPLAGSPVFRFLHDEENAPGKLVGKPFLLYVGNRALYKNFERLLRAYGCWPARSAVDLVVVGRPWSKAEERLLLDLGMGPEVHLATHVNDRDLCLLYNKALAFVYPSLYEGFGIPLLEAMACGCPVIASDIPTNVEVAGDCPIYFDSDDTDGVIAAFGVVLEEGRSSRRVQAGLARAKEFSWARTAKETLEVYHELSNA